MANLALIADFVAQEAALVGLDEEQVFNIQMAVDEACTNSMEHAYDGDVNGEVTVCCYEEDNDLVIRVSDAGKPFDPSSVPEPDISLPLEERSIGGLGLFLMRKLMDSVEFRNQNQHGNVVTMRKHLADATART